MLTSLLRILRVPSIRRQPRSACNVCKSERTVVLERRTDDYQRRVRILEILCLACRYRETNVAPLAPEEVRTFKHQIGASVNRSRRIN